MMNKTLRNQKGFTLIEIIAVLVILGILAAVAVPKFMNFSQDAKSKSLQGALAAVAFNASMDYAKGLLNGSYSSLNGPAANSNVVVGDFTGAWTQPISGSGTTTLTITNGPAGWNEPGVTGFSKVITLY